MPPASLHEISRSLALLHQRIEHSEDRQAGKWEVYNDRQDRIDKHLESTDCDVGELRKFMIQLKTIGVIIGIVWPLVVKYLLPK